MMFELPGERMSDEQRNLLSGEHRSDEYRSKEYGHEEHGLEVSLDDVELATILAANSLFHVHSKLSRALLVFTLAACVVSLETSKCQAMSIVLMGCMFFDTILSKFNLKVPHRFVTYRTFVHGFALFLQAAKFAFSAVLIFGTSCINDAYTNFAFWMVFVHSAVSFVMISCIYVNLVSTKSNPSEAQLYRYKLACLFEELPYDPDNYIV